GRLGGVRLRRRVVVGLVVRYGVVAAVVGQDVTGSGGTGHGNPARLPLRPGRSLRFGPRLSRPVGGTVRVGGRQREHLARCGLLRRRT
ncbi:hypothetical protein G3I61_05055, partial [Streptomyces diastaticus]|nr:hypothetical protein [Streptomyces diastaticus]